MRAVPDLRRPDHRADHRVGRRRWFRLPALVSAALMLATTAACSGGDDESAADDTTPDTTAPATTIPSDEEPLGTDPEAVEPYIEDLLHRFDEISIQIAADPSIAADEAHPLYTDLRSIMDPHSEMTEAIVISLVNRGEQGARMVGLDETAPPFERSVDGEVVTVSESEVRFPLCTRFNYRLDEGGRTQVSDGREERTEGVAVRVNGQWVISRLEGTENPPMCEEAEGE